jgi:hypothetical protein
MLGRTPRAERVKIKIKRFMIASQEDGLVVVQRRGASTAMRLVWRG